MHVEQAILTRRSVRGFLPTPVARETIERIIEVAARAPSGTHIQPWKVYACAGAPRDAIAEEACRAFLNGDQPRENELDAYPATLAEHFKARRRKVGLGYQNDNEVEIREGVNAGEAVVVAGQGNLKEGSKIRAVEG